MRAEGGFERIRSQLEQRLEGRELDFMLRVYAGGLDRYRKRLRAVGFEGLERVLDAGAGFGQWSAAMGETCGEVHALEYDRGRSEASDLVFRDRDLGNVIACCGSVTDLPYGDDYFTGIFSYSTIYQTDWRKALAEFARVLRTGGTLYVNINGPGWTLHNIARNPNPSRDFSPRKNALKSLLKSVSGGMFFPSADWILSERKVKRELSRLGFREIRTAGDGRLRAGNRDVEAPVFYRERYLGLTGVFEVLATKG